MIRATLFDAVGTLIHLREPVGETYARFAHDHGAELPAPALQAAFAHTMRAMPPMVFPDRSPAQVGDRERDWWRTLVRSVFAAAGGAMRPATFERCFDQLFAHYAGAAVWRCADGAVDLLAALRTRGVRTGVISNFDYRLPRLLAALGLSELLDVVVLPADAGAAKPSSRIFACALDRLGVRPNEAVYIGDDADDCIAGAQSAGLHAIDVAVVSDLRALLPLIDRRSIPVAE